VKKKVVKKKNNNKTMVPDEAIPQEIHNLKGVKMIEAMIDMEKEKDVLLERVYQEGGKFVEQQFNIANDFVEVKAGEEEKALSNKTDVFNFYWKKEYEDKGIKNFVIPYKTIDVIFNKKNIFINLQHPDPSKILYDIYDSEKWMKIIKLNKNGTNLLWKEDIPSFYSFRNFQPLLTNDEVETIQKNIIKTVNQNIKIIRMSKNMGTSQKRFVIYIKTIKLHIKNL